MANIKVRYKGIADERIISKKDLASHDIEHDVDLVWDASNGFALTLPASDAIEELLRAQGHFTISKEDGDVLSEATNTQSEGDVLVDTTTGTTTRTKK